VKGPTKKKGEAMAKEAQVTFPLPPGMSEEDFRKLFATFQKLRITGKARDTAARTAMKKLITLHQVEYDGYYKDEYAKAGGV